jgi:hypothetical protein
MPAVVPSRNEVRMSPRMAVNIPARILVRGIPYPVTIHNISRFGAFIVDTMPLARGTPVTLQLTPQSPRDLTIEGTVIYWLDATTANRLHKRAGAGLRFKEAIDEHDAAFMAAVTCRLVEKRLTIPPPVATPRATQPPPPQPAHAQRPDRQTLQMPELAQAALVSETVVSTPENGGRLAFAGDLATLAIADVLLGLARLRMTGRLEVKHEDVVATLELLEGDIIDVRSTCDARTRGATLFRMLSWRTGSFRMRSATPRATQARRVKISQLLIEYRRTQVPQMPPIPSPR